MTVEQFDSLLGAITALIVAVTACYVQLRQTHKLVNSRMTELVEATRASAQLKGELEGRDFAAKKAPADQSSSASSS